MPKRYLVRLRDGGERTVRLARPAQGGVWCYNDGEDPQWVPLALVDSITIIQVDADGNRIERT